MKINIVPQVNNLQKVSYVKKGEKLKIILAEGEVNTNYYYDLSNIKDGKIFKLNNFINNPRIENNEITIDLVYFINEKDLNKELNDIDIEDIDFEEPDEYLYLVEEELFIPDNEILKQEITSLKLKLTEERKRNERQQLEMLELMMGLI